MGKTVTLTTLVCNVWFDTAPSSRVQDTQFPPLANPGPQPEMTATTSLIIELNSPILDLGLRQAALSRKDLDHAIEIAPGQNH